MAIQAVSTGEWQWLFHPMPLQDFTHFLPPSPNETTKLFKLFGPMETEQDRHHLTVPTSHWPGLLPSKGVKEAIFHI